MFSKDIFRANDIRGYYRKDFDLSFTKALALSLAEFCRKKRIRAPQALIAEDARISSPEISLALVKNLQRQNLEVAFIGLAPSPLAYFLLHHCNLTFCIIVTASHNPSEYNGFKILFHRKYKIFSNYKGIKKALF